MIKQILAIGLIAVTLFSVAEPMPLNRAWTMDSGWTLLKDAVVQQQTLVLSKRPNTSECPVASRWIQVVPGKQYELTFEYRGDNVGAGGQISIAGPKDPRITERIYNYNTIWNPQVISFQAQGETVEVMFRLDPGKEAATTWELRNIVLKEKGEVLPSWGRKAIPSEPWGYCFADGAIRSDESNMCYHSQIGTNTFDVTVVDVWPENDHRLLITARLASPTTNTMSLQWSLDSLNLEGQVIERSVTGELQLDESWQKVDRQFRFPATTALLKLKVELKGKTSESVEFQDFSLQRIPRDD